MPLLDKSQALAAETRRLINRVNKATYMRFGDKIATKDRKQKRIDQGLETKTGNSCESHTR